VATGNVTVTSARWLPDGRRLLIVGTEPGKRLRAYLTDVNGATPRPIAPEGISFTPDTLPLSPDGERVALRSPDGHVLVYLLAGGEPVSVNGLKEDEMPIGWTGDGRGLLLLDGRPPRRVLKLDPASGRRELLKEIHPSDPSLSGPAKVMITPDGHSYVANYAHAQMTLYLVDGLK
jgi:dipeptidyl aminopeptidase/acylaminoacyl peptidase